ncbi:MAG: site-2 protease family protein [Chlorobia bacterium]|nr:site-2 protease family protein [Fimbriimonadaceae bacterium]
MDFGTVIHVLVTAVVLVVMLSILVAAHELGHYLFARLFGMGVEEFAIGFGKKPIWTWMRRTYSVDPVPGAAGQTVDSFTEQERYDYLTDGSSALKPEPIVEPTPSQVKLSLQETTDFTIRPWPLGGFVRIKGMIPEEDGSEIRVPGGFYSKAPWKRFIVLLAGPVFSVIAGIIILTGVFAIGGIDKVNYKPVIGRVSTDGAAYKAGIRPGDVVTRVDGRPVTKFYDIVAVVSDRSGQPVTMTYERNGKAMEATVVPIEKNLPRLAPDLMSLLPAKKAGRIGVEPDSDVVKVTFGEAFREAAVTPYKMAAKLVSLIAKPSELKENVGGPISIAQATSNAVKFGPGTVVLLAGLLSISVGIFNLLPIPPLDGGQMLVAVAETVRGGRRLSIKVQGAIAAVGFAIVMMFFVMVMFIDVGRLTNPTPRPDVKVIDKQAK